MLHCTKPGWWHFPEIVIMQNPVFDSYNEMAQTSLEALRKMSEINLRASERLFQHQMDLTHSMLESSTRNFEVIGKARGYQELMSSEAKMAQEMGQEWLKNYRETIEVLTTARDAVAEVMNGQVQILNNNLHNTAEMVKNATKAAA
jgi:phasin family protein